MSFVHIDYSSVEDLILQFQDLDVRALSSNDPNFVLIRPEHYIGQYGGLIYDTLLLREQGYIADRLQEGLSIVWWKHPHKHLGDADALVVGDRVAVTPTLFQQLIPLLRKRPARSSYYGTTQPFRLFPS